MNKIKELIKKFEEIISYVFFACKLEIMHQKWEKKGEKIIPSLYCVPTCFS